MKHHSCNSNSCVALHCSTMVSKLQIKAENVRLFSLFRRKKAEKDFWSVGKLFGSHFPEKCLWLNSSVNSETMMTEVLLKNFGKN